MSQTIRWIQRFQNFKKAFSKLKEAEKLFRSRTLTNLEKQGVVQAFEFTHELAWNVLKDYIEYIGGQKLIGSKDSTREAFQKGLIQDGEIWMAMIISRNQTTHTYNEKTAEEVIQKVMHEYYSAFVAFEKKMDELVQ